MARFDVFLLADGTYVLDCQSTWLENLNTRFIVPLMPVGEAPIAAKILNPVFDVDGTPLVMVTQYASTISTAKLRQKICTLGKHHSEIIDAIDTLILDG